MKGRVTWDEDNIGEIEANKPVRQKITEPKTPYHPMIDVDDDDSPSAHKGSFDSYIDNDNIKEEGEPVLTACNDVASCSRNRTGRSSGWTSSEDDADDDEERNLRFIERRKAHYDEFYKVKELRQKGSLLEGESDEDNNTELDGKNCDSSSLSASVEGIHIDGKKEALHPRS